MGFDVCKLFSDVFCPQSDDVLTVLIDTPTAAIPDNPAWVQRRKMAERWLHTLTDYSHKIGFTANPMFAYSATGCHNGNLPYDGIMAGTKMSVDNALKKSTIIIAMTEYSATAPLLVYCEKYKGNNLRVASMPTVEERMENTALSADYAEVARKCRILQSMFKNVVTGEVEFSSGHHCSFDLRFRTVHKDDGMLDAKTVAGGGRALANLPAGEVYVVPYEGEQNGIPSQTKGELPIEINNELVVFKVENNNIVEVIGNGNEAEGLRQYFDVDKARRNIAEFAVGLNDKAVVTGNTLEDEKSLGFHWAYGRSDHLGGINSPAKFKSPQNVVHQDMIYGKESPIIVKKLELLLKNGETKTILVDGVLQV